MMPLLISDIPNLYLVDVLEILIFGYGMDMCEAYMMDTQGIQARVEGVICKISIEEMGGMIEKGHLSGHFKMLKKLI